MNIKDALTLTLEQIINKLDTIFYLDPTSITQSPLEKEYIQNEFTRNAEIKPPTFSGIYEVERAYTLLHQIIIDRTNQINSMDDMNSKYIKALEDKEKELDNAMNLSNNYIMNISSIIDTATYNSCQILNLKSYNHFGFNQVNYKALMQSSQYKSTSSIISNKVFYEVFTGRCIIGNNYNPMFSMQGVANKVPKDKLEYKIHRLICLLIKMDKRELVSVLCRLLLSQLDLEERLNTQK